MKPLPPAEDAVAAHGLRLTGLPDRRWLSLTGALEWPTVCVQTDPSASGEEVALDVEDRLLRVASDIAYEELVHPLLGRVGSQLALARGGDAMHAGAVAGRDGAWCLIGSKGQGKSTLLAALATMGIAVITDDVLVFYDGQAMAGPRCVDLRPDADRFGRSTPVRPKDPRRRIALPAIEAQHPLAGIIHLERASRAAALRPIEHREAIERLLALRSEKGYPSDPANILELAALPNFVLHRAASWPALSATAELMAELVCGSAGGGHSAPRATPPGSPLLLG